MLNKPCVVEVEGDSPPILKRKVFERPVNASIVVEDIDDSPHVKRRLLTRNNTAAFVDEDDPGVLLSDDEEDDDDDDASKDSWIVSDSEDDEEADSSVSDLPEEVEEMRQRSRRTNVMFARAFFAALFMHLRLELQHETCSLESLVGNAKHGKETLRAYRKMGDICAEIDENYASTSDARGKCGAVRRDNENTGTCKMCNIERPVRWVYDNLQCCEKCHAVVDVYKLARAFWPNVVTVITLLFKSAFSITVKTVGDLETVAKFLTSDTPHVSRVYVLDELNKLFVAHEELQQKYKDAYDSVYLESSDDDSESI